jgi:hypothetical protein
MTRAASWFVAFFRLLGMDGARGSVSFSKLMAVAVLVAVWHRNAITTGIAVALLAASFGRSAYLAHLRANTPEQAPPTEGDV